MEKEKFDVEKFSVHSFLVIVLFLPALSWWGSVALVWFGIYDVTFVNLKTERKIFIESDIYKEAVEEEVGKLRAQDILNLEKRCNELK
jgi:hypothetical protein